MVPNCKTRAGEREGRREQEYNLARAQGDAEGVGEKEGEENLAAFEDLALRGLQLRRRDVRREQPECGARRRSDDDAAAGCATISFSAARLAFQSASYCSAADSYTSCSSGLRPSWRAPPSNR